ncbi:class I SAM-dependent DNA methyltransferase [Acuticoccus mangrovi]|uniref:Methyltransferase domain-containing protein n=1 Tax=Acuticoccus mangrovi TaxID=2796142 RepID=A0A934IKI5_9HYPH|nr:methyltransferase domain-containing protein [Acuticoccus mangrovi]MBJ3776656.1 methyltransferase domain-containing protein [Acuticoccus mangrovi]
MNKAPAFDADALGELYDAARKAEDAGDLATAERLFKECLSLDPADHCGVEMRLAAYGLAAPEAAPAAYVATLFDQNAETFDEVLVERLGYHVPTLARRLCEGHAKADSHILDLGCGTGLAGVAFAGLANTLVGVDLAEGMLAMADERDVYTDLYVGEAVAFLSGWDETPFDIILATDVWPYLGGLDAFIATAREALAPGGLLVTSTERADDLPDGWRVTTTQRFAHGTHYVRRLLEGAGFTVAAIEPIVVRHEEGVPVAGDLVLARRAD